MVSIYIHRLEKKRRLHRSQSPSTYFTNPFWKAWMEMEMGIATGVELRYLSTVALAGL